jgi:hypothetical protein
MPKHARQSATTRVTTRVVPITFAALVAAIMAPDAHAAAADTSWTAYLEQPASSDVKASAATTGAGTVSNAGALATGGSGSTTLTVASSSTPATVILDFGVEVEGTPYIDVQSHSGATAKPVVSLAVSETQTYLRTGTKFTGDNASAARNQSLTVSANAQLNGGFEGGFRFMAVTLTTPGTIVLSGAGVKFGGYLANSSDYQGYFDSSSTDFNRMFYDGAYTEQTDMQPAGVNGGTVPALFDGSKRDRAIWSGDMIIEGQGIADTLGTNGNDYVKQSLLKLITSSTKGSGLDSNTLVSNMKYSNSYSHWTVDAATNYYRNTNDASFAAEVLPYVEGQLAYDSTLTDSSGLISTNSSLWVTNGGYDWDPYDGSKTGVVTAYNVLYYRAIMDTAYLEASLGHKIKSEVYYQVAAKVRAEINSKLFNPTTKTYYLSETDHTTLAQDANSLSVLFGVAPTSADGSIVAALKTLWGTHGSAPFSGTAKSSLISPYVTAYEVEADYMAGDATDAESLLKLTWDQMMTTSAADYTGTFWENFQPGGTVSNASTSLSHGWASGPTSIMTGYVLGVQAVNPGYQTFTVTPHPGSMTWASGAVPTPYGQITVSWTYSSGSMSLTVGVPAGTTASVQLPSGVTATIAGGSSGTTQTITG